MLRCGGHLLLGLHLGLDVEERRRQEEAEGADDAQAERPRQEIVLEVGHPVARVAQRAEHDHRYKAAEACNRGKDTRLLGNRSSPDQYWIESWPSSQQASPADNASAEPAELRGLE